MATVLQVGKVRPVYRGEWDSAAVYEVLDWVLYRGLAYQAVQDVPANREPDVHGDYWAQTGMKGDKGDPGEVGPAGPAGVDGRNGLDGAQGPQGVGPQHRWDGTSLAFTNPNGTWAALVNLQGAQGGMGPQGPVGAQGIPGPQGAQGPQGPQGAVGPQGAPGVTPKLNNTVTSTSTTEAAAANAVRVAYDRGTAGVNAAATAQATANAAQTTANEAKNITNLVRTAPAAWCIPQAGADGKIHAGWIGGGGTLPVGYLTLLPFRYYQLPAGWYFCNGTRHNNGTAQANALNALSAEFKADWGITNNGATTNVPNWFHTDGRGPIMRAVNGTSRQVGSVEDDATISHTHTLTLSQRGWSATSVNEACFSNGTATDYAKRVTATTAAPSTTTANENRMLNRGMTPAIFLGV